MNRQPVDMQQYLLERKSLIDEALDRYLRYERIDPSPLHEALRYSTLDGGKRFRPVLTLATGELFGADRRSLVPFACAIELIHCYSLIHDDLPALDNDDLRRGRPSCHKRFGEAIALLAGDALLTEAFFIMSDPRVTEQVGPALVTRLIREISEAAGIRGMIGGQSHELGLEVTGVTAAALEDLDGLKTGALIVAAARVGAMIGAATYEDLDRMTKYARRLGLIFQITDDILDAHEVSGENAEPSKGRANYLTVSGVEGATARVETLLAECLEEMKPYSDAAEPLRGLARYVAERRQ